MGAARLAPGENPVLLSHSRGRGHLFDGRDCRSVLLERVAAAEAIRAASPARDDRRVEPELRLHAVQFSRRRVVDRLHQRGGGVSGDPRRGVRTGLAQGPRHPDGGRRVRVDRWAPASLHDDGPVHDPGGRGNLPDATPLAAPRGLGRGGRGSAAVVAAAALARDGRIPAHGTRQRRPFHPRRQFSQRPRPAPRRLVLPRLREQRLPFRHSHRPRRPALLPRHRLLAGEPAAGGAAVRQTPLDRAGALPRAAAGRQRVLHRAAGLAGLGLCAPAAAALPALAVPGNRRAPLLHSHPVPVGVPAAERPGRPPIPARGRNARDDDLPAGIRVLRADDVVVQAGPPAHHVR